jgi:ABC-type phosphate/phosphonate transport system ATPase subunit
MQINVVIVGAEYSGKTSILKSLAGEESYERFFSHDINERKL